VGGLGNLIPTSALGQLRMDEAMCLTEDIFAAFAPSFAIKDPAEKLANRLALCTGMCVLCI
jgi:hypothetical protein